MTTPEPASGRLSKEVSPELMERAREAARTILSERGFVLTDQECLDLATAYIDSCAALEASEQERKRLEEAMREALTKSTYDGMRDVLAVTLGVADVEDDNRWERWGDRGLAGS